MAATMAVGLLMLGAPTLAADLDPAVARVQSFDDVLVSAAKKGDLRGARVRQAIDQSFNIALMAQIAVGGPWNAFTPAEKASVIDALTRYTEARYAYEFKDFAGQAIVVDPNVQTRGLDRYVKAVVKAPGETPLQVGYRLRDFGGTPKIIDVIFDGVSQLATQRADFASAVASGGAAGLVRKLDESAAKLK